MRITIRHKLFLASLSLLIIPWLGYRYVIDMNDYLLKNQEQALLDRTRIVAAVLRERDDLFQNKIDTIDTQKQHLYVRALRTPIILDGYADDWLPYEERSQTLDHNAVIKHSAASPVSLEADYFLGSYDEYLYMLFKVKDEHIAYSLPQLNPQTSDHMQIAITDPQGVIKHFLIATFAPGKINVRPLHTDGRIQQHGSSPPVEAVWQEVAYGYNIELRIPLAQLGQRIGFTLADADQGMPPKVTTLIGTVNHQHHADLGTIIIPSPQAEELLTRLETPSSRTWVIDQAQRVIARTGQLKTRPRQHEHTNTSLDKTLSRLLLNLLLSQPSMAFTDELSEASTLQGEAISSALNGQPDTHWRHASDNDLTILTATHPVIGPDGASVIGAVVIEETSSASLIVKNRAMEIVINLSLITFFIAAIILLGFSSRLSTRIRHLRDNTDAAISADGRIVHTPVPHHASDEIGDLSRSFSNMLSRLSGYTRYLESMASKLSHELRTPIAVLRSSIESVDIQEISQQNATYLERARDGITRLDLIVSRMSEASRLEQTLQSERKQEINLPQLIERCVNGYQHTFTDSLFSFHTDQAQIMIQAAPDLIVQLLDKLVSNARDFALANTPIAISIKGNSQTVTLNVANQGEHLPHDMQCNLFDSMVSIRHKRSNEPHLGLGLYISRLITEFHHGQMSAKNTTHPDGVIFSVTLPRHISS